MGLAKRRATSLNQTQITFRCMHPSILFSTKVRVSRGQCPKEQSVIIHKWSSK